ncbi:hypothetical protein NEHOM01_1882 [Nematocida homosporus]|uniref:uncharacterized protein n=1 Tax=Nematocida homosporus TaxID=1912981 RepID=UPI002220A8A1|nr:uncharacterized protein NEHOM01_1882 [Nematocida homosporus]KAI5187037.1 hypothetical protein NEHOM01_1882 [Nematocida homosporus]
MPEHKYRQNIQGPRNRGFSQRQVKAKNQAQDAQAICDFCKEKGHTHWRCRLREIQEEKAIIDCEFSNDVQNSADLQAIRRQYMARAGHLLVEEIMIKVKAYGDQLNARILPVSIPVINSHELVSNYRGLSASAQQKIEKYLSVYLQKGYISNLTARSNFLTYPMIVLTVDGTSLLGLYLNALNAHVKPIDMPLPTRESLLVGARDMEVFSRLHLKEAIYKIPIEEQCWHMLAFKLGKRTYQFKVMPPGYKYARNYLHYSVAHSLNSDDQRCTSVYLDQILVFSPTIAQHTKDLEKVLVALKGTGLEVDNQKSVFMVPELDFIGTRVTHNLVLPKSDIVKKVLACPTPNCTTDIRRFLGLVGYLAPYLANRIELLKPFCPFLKQDAVFAWNKSFQEAFEVAKVAVRNISGLSIPDQTVAFKAQVTFMDTHCQIIVSQYSAVVCNIEKSLSPSLARLPLVDRELYAMLLTTLRLTRYVANPKIIFQNCSAMAVNRYVQKKRAGSKAITNLYTAISNLKQSQTAMDNVPMRLTFDITPPNTNIS